MPVKIIKVDENNVNEINNLRKGKATVLFFHPGCIHCTMMREPWEMMKKKLNSKNMQGNIYEVNGTCMDRVNHPIKENVMGFPTIMNVNNGKFQQNFEKERTMENMLDFVSQNIQSSKRLKPLTMTNKLKNSRNTKKRVRFQDVVNSIRLAKKLNKTKNRKPGKNKKTGKNKKKRSRRNTKKKN